MFHHFYHVFVEEGALNLHGVELESVAPSVGVNFLGTMGTLDGSNAVSFDFRVSQTWKAFFDHWHILGCKAVSLHCRLQALSATVKPSFFCHLGFVNLGERRVSKRWSLQLQMVCQMSLLNVDLAKDWHRRRFRRARASSRCWRFGFWDKTALSARAA